jgi:UDP-N-acetylglucosamine acyltransferase
MIHETAIISPEAKIGKNVEVGPYAVVGPKVTLADGVIIKSHVTLEGRVTIGENSKIFQYTNIGNEPQDLSYRDEDTSVEIGKNCGNRVRLKGINIIGLKRAGYSKQDITEVVDFYRTMEASALSPRAFVNHDELMQEFEGNKIIDEMREFIKNSEVGIAPFWD